ncbi:hypothetical protein O181_121034 [Austropuccinia psidii MF-1]|uniref:Uncharacterized protein n=1 Tax=Austropuccinia psidii MF-1 TaxID=1389203 RepID=A0A9Q3KKA5_9BASI|nr:hypothetical protein [Austropuccinia psidii MF-1]
MSRQHQDNVNHHMCNMRMSLKAQTHFNTICNVRVITSHGATKQFGMLTFVDEMTSARPPGHLNPLPCLLSRLNLLPHPRLILQRLSMLTCPHYSPNETPTLPPHLRPYHSLHFHTPALTMFTLAEGPPDMAPTPLPSQHASDTAYHPYACVVPSQHASDTVYHPYACVVPSQHGSDTAFHPYAHIVPSRHGPDPAYHPYTQVVPSQHASDTAYHPYAHLVPSEHGSDTAYHPYALIVPSQHGSNAVYHPYAVGTPFGVG